VKILALAFAVLALGACTTACCCPDLCGCDCPGHGKPTASAPPAQAAPAPAPAPAAADEIVLFDGKSLKNWKKTEYGGEGEVKVKDGLLVVEMGAQLSGVTWAGPELPSTDYEVSLEAMKIDGSDFFCGIAFRVGKSTASFVAGGWGGGVCGISSIDGGNASENETSIVRSFAKDRWYQFRLRVLPEKILVWLDGEKIIDVEIKGRTVEIHPAMESGLPFGLATFTTTAAYRNIKLKKLPPGAK
jgi:hypothetical protein